MEIITGDSHLVIDPTRGGAIDELKLEGVQVIQLQDEVDYQGSLLFPFPNRLSNGAYHFEGKSYQFPHNDFGNPNALHGFIADRPMAVKLSGDEIALEYNYDGTLAYYPFPFHFQIAYHLRKDVLAATVIITNKGLSNMPCGFGWHPYFKVDGLQNALMQLPEVRKVGIDELMIPNGQKHPYMSFDTLEKLDGHQLDTCFELLEKDGAETILQVNDQNSINIWQDGAFGFIQVFTHPNDQCVAIEPMTCNIDALNNGDGLKVLAPNEEWQMSFGVQLFS